MIFLTRLEVRQRHRSFETHFMTLNTTAEVDEGEVYFASLFCVSSFISVALRLSVSSQSHM